MLNDLDKGLLHETNHSGNTKMSKLMVLLSSTFEASSVLLESVEVDIETVDSYGIRVVGDDVANSTY